MAFLSCFTCGGSGQEKPEQPSSHQNELTSDAQESQPHSIPQYEPEHPQLKISPSSNQGAPPRNNLQRETTLASTAPSDALYDLTRAPEESFGENHMITDEDIRRRAYNRSPQPSSTSLEPGATEEDRWFEN